MLPEPLASQKVPRPRRGSFLEPTRVGTGFATSLARPWLRPTSRTLPALDSACQRLAMHVRELLELGAILGCHGGELIRQSAAARPTAVQQYWDASRRRLEHWSGMLQSSRSDVSRGVSCEVSCDITNHPSQAENSTTASRDGALCRRPPLRPVLEEIVASELLLRVWSGIACGWDRRHGASVYQPLIRSVLQGHEQLRNRVLRRLLEGPGLRIEEAAALNRIRHRVERWTDMLLAPVLLEHDVLEFAFNAQRLIDFADDLRDRRSRTPADPARRLLLVSLRAAFETDLHRHSPSAELNRRVAASILACLDNELFEQLEAWPGLWIERISCVARETQAMVDELLAMEGLRAGP